MPKRTIEIDDTLQERVDSAIEDVKELLLDYLKDNPDTGELPDLSCLDYDGQVHEIVDGSVPIYTNEIEATWYLHANVLEEAYDGAGFGENPRENSGMVAIYCYINDRVGEWYYDRAQAVFEKWYDQQHPGEDREAADEQSEED